MLLTLREYFTNVKKALAYPVLRASRNKYKHIDACKISHVGLKARNNQQKEYEHEDDEVDADSDRKFGVYAVGPFGRGGPPDPRPAG
jgi:hypothetical protein